MKRILIQSIVTVCLVVGFSLTGSRLEAKELTPQKAPTAAEILDREAEAAGGKAANQKIKTFVMKAKIKVADKEIELAVHFAGPKKQVIEVALAGVGSEQTVVNGDLAWHTDSITGSRLLQGDEREAAFKKAADFAEMFTRVGNWRQQFKKTDFVGEGMVEGKAVYKVLLVNQHDEIWLDHFDQKSGLMVRRDVLDAPQGKVLQTVTNTEFRKVDGITHAYEGKISGGAMEMFITVDEVVHNANIPEALFVLPAELKNQVTK